MTAVPTIANITDTRLMAANAAPPSVRKCPSVPLVNPSPNVTRPHLYALFISTPCGFHVESFCKGCPGFSPRAVDGLPGVSEVHDKQDDHDTENGRRSDEQGDFGVFDQLATAQVLVHGCLSG